MSIGTQIAKRRRELKLTQDALASKMLCYTVHVPEFPYGLSDAGHAEGKNLSASCFCETDCSEYSCHDLTESLLGNGRYDLVSGDRGHHERDLLLCDLWN